MVYIDKDVKTSVTYPKYITPEYKIKPFDILSINLNNLEINTSEYFNNPFTTDMVRGQSSNAFFYFSGYIVSDSGYIDVPLIGNVSVLGLTLREVKAKLDNDLSEYMKFANVSVKLVNFRITLFGEVNSPGIQYIYEEKITLLQALAQAGNPTEFADTENIRIVRETDDGTKIIHLNILDPSIVSSEYYFLMPNDIIYIEPTRARAFQMNSRVLALTLSITSIGLAIVTFILRN